MQKKKTAGSPRVVGWLLALSMAVGMLPVTAAAAASGDAPETWPAPDSRYTAPGEEPVYIFLDYRDEDTGGVLARHTCVEGAQFINDVVKANTADDGYVRFTCDQCGSWAQIDVPAVSIAAITLGPAYQSIVDNGVEFSGDPYTLLYDVSPAYQRYLGTNLKNEVSVTETGIYSLYLHLSTDIYEDVRIPTNEKLTVYPKNVPWAENLIKRCTTEPA